MGVLLLVGANVADAAVAADSAPRATASIDPDSDPEADSSPVYAIAEANGRYYIGGNFQTVAGETQPYLAAIDVATGRLDQTWRPQVNGEVLSIAVAPDGSAVYVGGKFFKINNSYPSRIAKLDPITGAVDNNFDPDADAAVDTLATDGTNVWAGGTFTTIGGVAQAHLAKLDSNGVVDTAFAPVLDGKVLDLQLEGARLYMGGNFTTIDGVEHKRIAAVNPATGVADAWAPESNFKVYEVSMKPDGTILYAAGAGSLGAGGNSLTAWDTTTGEQLWRRINSGDFQAVVATDDLVYIGTHGEYVYIDNNGPFLESDDNPNAVRRNKLAAFDPITGELAPWNPGANSTWGVWELHIGPSGLAVGGDFVQIGGVVQPHFAVFNGPGIGNQSPAPTFSYFCTSVSCVFDGASSSDPDGTVASYAWDFGNGITSSQPQVTIAKTDLANRPTATLTVTDNAGASATTSNPVVVTNGNRNDLPVEVVDVLSYTGQGTLTSQGASFIDSGDYGIAIVTMADATAVITPPAGWTSLNSQVAGSMKSEIFVNPAPQSIEEDFVSDKPGVKGTLTLSIYRYLDTAAPLQSFAVAEPVLASQHTAPAITVPSDSTIVHYWANRSATGVSLAAPANEATVSSIVGLGGGHINSTMSVTTAEAGTSPARVAIGDLHTRSALGWTIGLVEGTPAPICVATVTADDTIFVDWSDVRDASTYTLRRNGAWVTTNNDVTSSSYLDAPGEGTWDYELRAITPAGRVDVPCTPSVTVDPPAPFVQTCSATLNDDESIDLAWDAIPGENGYSVRRNGTYLASAGNTLEYSDSPGEGTWDYVIRSNKDGVVTNTTCNPTGLVIDPPAPVAQTCTATLNADDTILVTWDAVPGANGYSVRRDGNYLTFVGNTFSYVDDPGAGTWDYAVRSTVNGVKTTTSCDPTGIVIDGPPPVAQTCSAVLNADSTITLTWDPIAGENSYNLRRNGTYVGELGNTLTSVRNPGPGTYTYEIRSNLAGTVTSTVCSPIDIVIVDSPPTGQTCTAVENADGSVTLTWDEIPGEDTYIVRRNGGWLTNTGALTYTDVFADDDDDYVIRSRQGNATTNTTCE